MSQPEEPPASEDLDSIGVAEMKEDGTIVLRLRGRSNGITGDATLVYPPTHQDYLSILAHIGNLAPGDVKPVRPWE